MSGKHLANAVKLAEIYRKKKGMRIRLESRPHVIDDTDYMYHIDATKFNNEQKLTVTNVNHEEISTEMRLSLADLMQGELLLSWKIASTIDDLDEVVDYKLHGGKSEKWESEW